MFLGAFLPNWLLKTTELTPSEKLTYARLCQFSGKNGQCFPKIETIGEEIGLSDDQVRRNIHSLEEIGLVEVVRNPPNTNEYKFLWCHLCKGNPRTNARLTLAQVQGSIYEENHLRESYNTSVGKETPSLRTGFKDKSKEKDPPMPRSWLPDVLKAYGDAQGWSEKPNKVAYKRFARASKDLWQLSKGDFGKVNKAILWVKQQKFPSWTLEAVVKRWYDATKEKVNSIPDL